MKKKCLIIGIKSSLGIAIGKVFDSKYDVIELLEFKIHPTTKKFLDFENIASLDELLHNIPNIDSLIFVRVYYLVKN